MLPYITVVAHTESFTRIKSSLTINHDGTIHNCQADRVNSIKTWCYILWDSYINIHRDVKRILLLFCMVLLLLFKGLV